VGLGAYQVVAGEAITHQWLAHRLNGFIDSWGLTADGSKQLFPLTFKANSMISNPAKIGSLLVLSSSATIMKRIISGLMRSPR
jgi:hypothetical protein